MYKHLIESIRFKIVRASKYNRRFHCFASDKNTSSYFSGLECFRVEHKRKFFYPILTSPITAWQNPPILFQAHLETSERRNVLAFPNSNLSLAIYHGNHNICITVFTLRCFLFPSKELIRNFFLSFVEFPIPLVIFILCHSKIPRKSIIFCASKWPPRLQKYNIIAIIFFAQCFFYFFSQKKCTAIFAQEQKSDASWRH